MIHDYIESADGRKLKALEDFKNALDGSDQIGNLPARSLTAMSREPVFKETRFKKQTPKEGGRTVATVSR